MLNERIVISHFCIGHELFYFLFFAFGADEQHIIGFGYDLIVKSFDNDQFFPLHGYDTARCVVE